MIVHKNNNNKESDKDFIRWYEHEFLNRTIQKSTPLYEFVKNNVKFQYSSAIRDFTVKYLKKYVWIDTLNTIVTVFKLRNTNSNEHAVIYGFLYSIVDKDKKITHTYYCCGPSLLSRDGEYRQRILLYNGLSDIIKRYKKIWNALEEHILYKIENLPWNYYTEYFYPTIKQQEIEPIMIASINKERFPIKFLIISWFVELFNIINNIPVNHVNQTYINSMGWKNSETMKADKKFYDILINNVGLAPVLQLRHELSAYKVSNELGSLKMGQKLTPLNISEIQNPFNIKYKPWREFLISEKVQDLAINGICKGFPYISDYFYLKDIRKTLFDNVIQYTKLEHSDLAMNITRLMIEAQRATYQTTDIVSPIRKKNKKSKVDIAQSSIDEINFWLSEKFKILYEKINDPIEYSKRNIIMTEVALGIIGEYVGRTFYDFLLLNNPKTGSEFYIDETGDALNNYEIWAKYMFEYVYTLLAMNIHNGVIHGDLHLNNGTIHPLYFKDMCDLDKLGNKKPHMLYILKSHQDSEEEIVYAFPSKQYHSCIIDFSRSVIRPSMVDKYEDFNIIESKNIKIFKQGQIKLLDDDDKSIFHKEQVIRILGMIEYNFPELYAENKTQLEILIFNSLEELFPLLTAIDIYRFSCEIKKYLMSIESNKSPQVKLINKINNISCNIFTSKLKEIINDPSKIMIKDYQRYSNWIILNECFSEFIVMSTNENIKDTNFYKDILQKEKTIIDVDCLSNKITYSLDRYETFPEFLKHTKKMNDNGKISLHNKHKKDLVDNIRINIENTKRDNLKIISLIAKRHKEKYF